MKFASWLSAFVFSILTNSAGAGVRVDFPWERSWPVVTPKTAAGFGIVLKNDEPLEKQVTIACQWKSPSGTVTTVEQAIALPAGGEAKIPWSMEGREMGCWVLSYRVAGIQPALEGKVQFGYLVPAGPTTITPEFMFGLVAHSERFPAPEREKEMEAAAFAGCKVLRANPTWEGIQPQAGQWNWQVMDAMVTSAERLGMELQVLLAFTPRWAAPEWARKEWPSWMGAPPDLGAWREFVGAISGRYRNRVRLWEIWNEPDLAPFWVGTTEQYIELARVAVEELRKADPYSRILTGGFATLRFHGAGQNLTLQESTLKSIGSLFDYHAVHEHGGFEQFVQILEGPYTKLRSSVAKAPPYFFNETAVYSAAGQEIEQAEVLVKKAAFARSLGAAGYLWYDLRNDGVDPANPEHNYGLLTQTFEPKPAYLAFNTFARLIAPKGFIERLKTEPGHWNLAFGDRSERILVYWNENSGAAGEQAVFYAPQVSAAKMVDLNGNETPVAATGETLVVPVGKTPRYLILQGAASVSSAGRLAGAKQAYSGAPEEEIAVESEFRNPTEQPVRLDLQWRVPAEVKLLSASAERLLIPPHGIVVATARVKLPQRNEAGLGYSSSVQIKYSYQEITLAGTISIPVRIGTVLARPSIEGREPDMQLSSAAQLASFVEGNPQLVSQRWQGPADLSARVWLGLEPEFFLLRVEVTDDRHYQDQIGSDIWRGDSVQISFAHPNESGRWEIGAAELSNGAVETAVWSAPGTSDRELAKSGLRVAITTQTGNRTYQIRIPRELFRITDDMLSRGFRLNLAVNDNDGEGRASALQIAPGLVENKSMDSSPLLRFERP